MEMKRIAVAILNWNGQSLLEKFLPSVLSHSPEGDVIVIDNASTDSSVAWLSEHHPEVRQITLPENLGYAGGYNEALKHIEHEYVVLLNSDVETTEGWLAPIIERFDSNPDIAAIQPKIKAYKQKESFEYAGASGGFIDHLGYPFCRGRIFDHLEEDHGQYNDAMQVFWSTGACLAVRSTAYEQSGGLDPVFFAHMEEIDLCWRFQRFGFQCWVEPASTVYHIGGGTLNSLSSQKTYLNFRNNLLLLTKNVPSNRVFSSIFTRLVLDGLAGVQFLLKGQISHTVAILKAHFHFYGMYGNAIKGRKGPFPWPLTGVYQRSIVQDVFLQKKTKYSELPESAFFRR